MNRKTVNIAFRLVLMLLCLSGNVSLARQINDQQHYEQQLNEKLDQIKALRELHPNMRILFDAGHSPPGTGGSKYRKRLMDSLANNDYESLRTIFKKDSLAISIYKRTETLTKIYFHPYQNRNTAYKVVQAILAQDADALNITFETVDDSLEEYVYIDGVWGVTPMSFAVEKQDLNAITALLDAGVSPDNTMPGDIDFLSSALYYGRLDIVALLLNAGANVNTKLSSYFDRATLLSYSAKTGNASLLQRLLDSGADANTVDLYGWSPLMEAIHAQNWNLFELLLPVSDTTIISTREVKANDRKKLDRSYPLCNAMFVAEQIDSQLGERFRAALLAKTGDAVR